MEKRPRGIYLILSIWLGLGLLLTFSQWSRIIKENELFGVQTPAIVGIMGLIFFIFAIWEIKGFINLKKTQRWIGIIYFSIWSLNVATSLTSFAIKGALSPRLLSAFLFILIANAVSVYFLTKQKYVNLYEQSNKEIDSIKLQQNISKMHLSPATKMQKRLRWIIAIAISILVIIIYQSLILKRH